MDINLFGQYPQSTDFQYPLSGDIQGTKFNVGLVMGSATTTTVDVKILVTHNKTETVLASTNLTASGTAYTLYSKVLKTSADPTTASGDVLILRVTNTSGGDGAIHCSNDTSRTSYLEIPPVK